MLLPLLVFVVVLVFVFAAVLAAASARRRQATGTSTWCPSLRWLHDPCGVAESRWRTAGIEAKQRNVQSGLDTATEHEDVNVDAEGAYADPAKIDNSCGWLYTPSCDDFGSTASSSSRGFTNLVTILPREQTRASQVLCDVNERASRRDYETRRQGCRHHSSVSLVGMMWHMT